MKPDSVIVRYGEIFLKSDYVRRQFTKRLKENIHAALKQEKIIHQARIKRHRIYVDTDEADRAAQRTSKVFGVVSASPALKSKPEFDQIQKNTIEYAKGVLKGSFAVRAKRDKKYPYTTTEIEQMLGQQLVQEYKAIVDLSNPETTIGVEIRSTQAYIYHKVYQGPGGLPYATQSTLACEVEERMQALACYMMMRRGCRINMVGSRYLEKLGYFTNPKPKTYAGIEEALKEGAVGVVSPQTLAEIGEKPDKYPEVPTYWPLTGLRKEEIEDMAAKAGL